MGYRAVRVNFKCLKNNPAVVFPPIYHDLVRCIWAQVGRKEVLHIAALVYHSLHAHCANGSDNITRELMSNGWLRFDGN